MLLSANQKRPLQTLNPKPHVVPIVNNQGYLPAIQVTLYQTSAGKAAEGEEARRVGRLSFVDLAGSERANRTGNVGARLK